MGFVTHFLVFNLGFSLALVSLVFLIYWLTVPKCDSNLETENSSFDDPAFRKGEEANRLDNTHEPTGVHVHKSGWIKVTREYTPEGQGASGPEKNRNLNSENTYMGMVIQSCRNFVEKPLNASSESLISASRHRKPTNTFWGVLKHGNLFLYENEGQLDVKYVIVLDHFDVGIWPRNIPDGELFIKRHAICLTRRDLWQENCQNIPPPNSFFIFVTNNSMKEDWYFSLIQATKLSTRKGALSCSAPDSSIDAVNLQFRKESLFEITRTIHSNDEHLQTRWLNAFIGRLFLGISQTDAMETFMMNKIKLKLSRIRRPSFLSDIHVNGCSLGSSIPYILNPRLRDLNPDGELNFDIDVCYSGNARIEVSTTATIQLGNRFKPRQVNLVLAVVLCKLEGTALVKIKKPPTNRIWFGFYDMPNMELDIEPIVSSRQIKLVLVLRAIQNKIRETVQETIVLPNMDDFAFFNTETEFFRGGIWDHSLRKAQAEAEKLTLSQQTTTLESESTEQLVSTPSDESSLADIAITSTKAVKRSRRKSLTDTLMPKLAQNSSGGSLTPTSSAPAIVSEDLVSVTFTSEHADSVTPHDNSTEKGISSSCSTALSFTPLVLPDSEVNALVSSVESSASSSFKESVDDLQKPSLELEFSESVQTESLPIMPGSPDGSKSVSSEKKKDRLSAALAAVYEKSAIEEDRLKWSIKVEKPTLGVVYSSTANAVKKWGAQYIAKKNSKVVLKPSQEHSISSDHIEGPSNFTSSSSTSSGPPSHNTQEQSLDIVSNKTATQYGPMKMEIPSQSSSIHPNVPETSLPPTRLMSPPVLPPRAAAITPPPELSRRPVAAQTSIPVGIRRPVPPPPNITPSPPSIQEAGGRKSSPAIPTKIVPPPPVAQDSDLWSEENERNDNKIIEDWEDK